MCVLFPAEKDAGRQIGRSLPKICTVHMLEWFQERIGRTRLYKIISLIRQSLLGCFKFKLLMSNGVLILFLLATALAAPVVFQSQPNFSFFDYPQMATIINKTPLPCLTNANSTASQNISCTANSWNVAAIVDGFSEKAISLDSGEQRKKGCSPSINLFQQRNYELTKVDYDPNNLLPGSVLQMVNPDNFANGVIPTFIPENKRTPLNIVLSNGINLNFTIPTPSAFPQKIKDILPMYQADLNNKPIQVYIEQAATIERVLRSLGLTTKTYEEISIAASTAKKVQSNQGKIVIVLIQKLFSATLDLSNNGSQKTANMVDAVFGPLYTEDDFIQVARSGFWGIGKVPRVITQTNFGRLFVLSIDDSAESQKLVGNLAACSSFKLKQSCISAAISAIQDNPTVRYYVAGVDEFAITERNPKYPVYKQFVNWTNVFSDFRNPKSAENLRPLSAKALDLLGQKFVQTETRFYSVLKCASVSDIVFKVSELTGEVNAKMKGNEDSSFSKLLFTAKGPQVIDIGSITLWQPFELQITLNGKKDSKGWKVLSRTKYSRKLKFSIFINGVEKLAREIGKTGSDKESEQVIIKIDPRRGIAK